MKKILILGAGIYQVPLIKKAKEMGLYTIVCSIKGNYPGFSLADKIYYENTTDIEACIKIAESEEINGVCTTGTDVALPTLGAIVDKLKLYGPTYSSAIMASNKLDMKIAFSKNNVRSAKFKKVHSLQECILASKELKYPLILKVVDSSGSRGIRIVRNECEIKKNYNLVLPYTKKDYIIIEEFIEGVEFGAQAFVSNGKLLFVMPHGDKVFKSDTGVPIGHYVPYNLKSEILEDLKKQIELSIKALNIENSAINVDLILRDNKVYILEIGARAGATCLPELVSIYYGIDYYEVILKQSIGDPINIDTTKHNTCAAELIISAKTGQIVSYNTDLKDKNLIDFKIDYKIGDNVNKFAIGPDRIGQIITKGQSLDDALLSIENLKQNLNLIIE